MTRGGAVAVLLLALAASLPATAGRAQDQPDAAPPAEAARTEVAEAGEVQAGAKQAMAKQSPDTPQSEGREMLLQTVYRGQRIGEPVAALLRSDGVLLQLDALLAALHVEHEIDPDGAVSGRLHPGDTSFRFDPDGGYRIGWRPGSLERRDYAFVDGMLLVSAATLARLLPARIKVDERRQAVNVEATGPLPLDLERAREVARTRLAGSTPAEPMPRTAFPYEAFGSPFGDIRLSAGSAAGSGGGSPFRYDGLLSGEIGYATGMLFFLGDGSGPPRDARFRIGREDPEGGAFGIPGVTRAFAGDVSSFAVPLIGTAGQSRGVAISAFPLDRPDSFDRTAIEGDAPPGWDVELYRSTDLLGLQRAGPDGRFRFEDVALVFGDNLLRVVLYGPQGQVRTELRRFQIGAGMAPPGSVYWRGFAGQPNQRLLAPILSAPTGNESLGFSGEVEVGLFSFLTANAFAGRAPETLLFNSPMRSTYGSGLRLSVANVYLEGDIAQQMEGGRAWKLGGITGFGGLTLSGRHARYEDFHTVEATRGLSPLRAASSLRLNYSVPIAGFGLGLSATGERFEQTNGTVETSVRGDVRYGLLGLYFSHEIDLHRFAYGAGAVTDRLFYRPSVSTSIGSLRLSAAVRLDTSTGAIDEAVASASYRLNERTFVSMSGSRISQFDTTQAAATQAGAVQIGGTGAVRSSFAGSAAVTRDFGAFFSSLTVGRDPTGGYFAGLGLNTSFGFDRIGRLTLSSRQMAQQGSTDAFVYHDRDGDGRYDATVDAPVPDARLLLNGYRNDTGRTDATGRVFLPGLATTRPVTAEVEQPSLPDPFLAPANGGLRFLPRPGQPFPAAIAVVETGEIAGSVSVQRDGEAIPLAGLVLELLDLAAPTMAAAEPTGPGFRLPALFGALLGRDTAVAPSAKEPQGYDVAEPSAGPPRRGAGRPVSAMPGRLRMTKRSQFDGAFLFDLVPPGRYLVRIRPGQVVRGSPMAAAGQEVTITRAALMIEGVDFSLIPPAVPAQGGGE